MKYRLFVLVRSSQQREERTKKRRRCYRAFGFVAVGACGTRSARTVLALFPPSSLRLHRPIKAGILLVLLLVFSTPSPFGYFLYQQGEDCAIQSFNPSPQKLLFLRCLPYIAGATRGEV